jgi:uncharacterized Zn finger protein (UPF0148 family)
VFDPLAIMMLLAATESLKWNREKKYKADDGPLSDEQIEQLQDLVKDLPTGDLVVKSTLFPEDTAIDCAKCGTTLVDAPGIGLFCPNKDCNTNGEQHDANEDLPVAEVPTDRIVKTEEVNTNVVATDIQALDTEDDHLDGMDAEAKTAARRWKEENPGQTLKTQQRLYEIGKIDTLPWMSSKYYLGPTPDNAPAKENTTGFGTSFPLSPKKGDTFLRVDRLPSVLYKYNGNNWIEVDKQLNNRYAYNEAYIDHLIVKIDSGEYDPDLLSEAEQEQIERRLTGQ